MLKKEGNFTYELLGKRLILSPRVGNDVVYEHNAVEEHDYENRLIKVKNVADRFL